MGSTPSRTAAIGSTRVARSAGSRLASTVTTVPTTSETMIVRVAKIVLPCGSSIPKETNSASRPFAIPRPMKSPETDARTPITPPSTITEAITCRRVAPSVRSVPNSRARCAIVIERVLAITKMPTNSAIPPKASRNFWRMLVNALVSCTCFAASCVPLRTCAVGGRIGLISATSCAGEMPCRAATSIPSSLPTLPKIFCAVGRSKMAMVAPPIDETLPSLTTPVIRYCWTGPRATAPIVLPTL